MMKKIKRIITSFLILSACFSGPSFAKAGDLASKPDSAYLFSYATDKDNNHNVIFGVITRQRD